MKLEITSEQYAQLSDGLKGALAAAGRLRESLGGDTLALASISATISGQLDACLARCQTAVHELVPVSADEADLACAACGDYLEGKESVVICSSCAEEAGVEKAHA